MTRLYVVGEGDTEVAFVNEVLRPAIETRGVLVHDPPNLRGYHTYARLRKFICRLLDGGPSVRVTTMIDLYKLPRDSPSFSDCDAIVDPYQRVGKLEAAFAADINDDRFIPYLQLHEFEALILVDLDALGRFYLARARALQKLKEDLDRLGASPEEIDRRRPPSYRIKECVPEYDKKLAGPIVTLEIGLGRLRGECRHFGEWLTRLEQLGQG